jgi:protein-S-isoprenylcysteine O-methyltransferase Ste14
MVNIKQVIFSFILPFMATIIVPCILLIFVENRTIFNLINTYIGFLVLGIIIIGLGIVLFLDCNVLFYKIGKGTLMGLPKMQTKNLIVVGPYKYVRNPMYISVVAIVIGEGFIFGSWVLLIWVLIFWIMFNVYLIVAEEKGLVKRFGDEYLHYKQNVRGWIPQLKPYKSDKNTEN